MEDNKVQGVKQWYVVNTFKNKEDAVKESLEKKKKALHLENNIFRIIVAKRKEDVLDKEGKPTGKVKEYNYYEGYIFVEMIMSDDAWYVIRNTPNVSGFVGSSGKGTKPFPMRKEDIIPVLKRLNLLNDEDTTKYEIGDHVKIVSGPFEGTEGHIENINEEAKEVSIVIRMFGRDISRTADFAEIEKMKD